MYYRTTKLKRYKLLRIALNVISFPLRFPIFLFFIISEKITKIAEWILDTCDKFLYWVMENIVKYFKFDEIADKQYEKNREKFKTDY